MGKKIFIVALLCAFIVGSMVPSYAQPADDLEVCEELLDEATENMNECDAIAEACNRQLTTCQKDLEDCDGRCGWKAIIIDRKVQAAVISVSLALIGGVITLLAVPPGG